VAGKLAVEVLGPVMVTGAGPGADDPVGGEHRTFCAPPSDAGVASATPARR
jgi:hypothetical protein